jgi:hypothetical protein
MASVAEIAELVVQEAPVWRYQTEDATMVPYVEGNPSKVFSDEFLFFLYSRCKEDGLLDVLFPGMPLVTPARFVAYLKDRPVLVGLVKPDFEVAGFGFIYEVQGEDGARKGTIGFAFFKKWWGTGNPLEIARLALQWWFTEAKYSIIFGTTRWTNRIAWRFAQKLGFQSVGRVPKFFSKNGQLEDMHLMWVTPETFRGAL